MIFKKFLTFYYKILAFQLEFWLALAQNGIGVIRTGVGEACVKRTDKGIHKNLKDWLSPGDQLKNLCPIIFSQQIKEHSISDRYVDHFLLQESLGWLAQTSRWITVTKILFLIRNEKAVILVNFFIISQDETRIASLSFSKMKPRK